MTKQIAKIDSFLGSSERYEIHLDHIIQGLGIPSNNNDPPLEVFSKYVGPYASGSVYNRH